jgi:N6-L-threonylcarbamoyladenine synthase
MEKIIMASKQTGINTIVICGGVSANSEIRDRLKVNSGKYNWNVHIPKISYTTDNAAMIAITGQLKYQNNMFSDFETSANPRLKI